MSINTEYSRISLHGISGVGATFSIPSQEDFTAPGSAAVIPWSSDGTELLNKEIGVNTTDSKVFIRIGGTINEFNLSSAPSADAIIYTTKIGLSSADILSLNTTPILVAAAQGATKYIEVISASAYMSYNSIAYTGSFWLKLGYFIGLTATNGYENIQAENTQILVSEITRINTFTILNDNAVGPDPTASQILLNEPLKMWVDTSNPTAGNSSMVVNVAWRVVDTLTS